MEVMTDSSTTVEDRDALNIEAPSEIFPMIDNMIRECSGRDLVSASDMVNFLLDLRVVIKHEGIV